MQNHPSWKIKDQLHFELYSTIEKTGHVFVDWQYNSTAYYFWQLPPYDFKGIQVGIHNINIKKLNKWECYDKLVLTKHSKGNGSKI